MRLVDCRRFSAHEGVAFRPPRTNRGTPDARSDSVSAKLYTVAWLDLYYTVCKYSLYRVDQSFLFLRERPYDAVQSSTVSIVDFDDGLV
jgi:hypothetical protein